MAAGASPIECQVRNLGPLRLASLGAIGFALIAFFVFVVARMTSPGYGLLLLVYAPERTAAGPIPGTQGGSPLLTPTD